jgi:hypothetical protein
MSDITVENILSQIVKLPQSDRFVLWQRLEQLLKPAPEPPAPQRKLQPIPMPDSTREFQWLAEHARQYKGQWVALDGDRLIAHGNDHDAVFAAAQADGAYLPLIHFVEDPDHPVTIIWA